MLSPESAPNVPSPPTDEIEYSRALESLRIDLRCYVRSLLIDKDATDDVLQEVFVLLWERRDEFAEKLRPSAFRVAWFKALAYRRDRQREHLVHFSEQGLRRIAGAAEDVAVNTSDRLDALRQCLGELAARELELLDLKYIKRQPLAEFARKHGHSPNSAQKALSRVRLALRKCIESKLTS
ncbi:MAG: sigma-70 family RNA polymerase sigma factor [Akkermansiaceae bacterium]|jgi:RNA polymerase sigma-70 factor (ECF subfamily)|nr:sigma-70 family RNA polymerase sigma factor [Akkermansiaceae bacterium]